MAPASSHQPGLPIEKYRLTVQVQERQYGSHPAGEGGEYETLTLSTPLFSHRLRITKSTVVVTDPEPYPVAYLRVEGAELEEKSGWVRPRVGDLREMLGLEDQDDGLDAEGRRHLRGIGFSKEDMLRQEQVKGGSEAIAAESLGFRDVQEALRGRWFSVSVEGRTVEGEGVADELRRCLEAARRECRPFLPI